jgi:uncharacterized membrane protein YphA (DoxX/SURF4 family)
MPLLRRIARPLLASTFVYGGIGALRKPGPHAEKARPVVNRIADVLPEKAPKDAETLVRIDGAVKVGAGAMLGLGKAPRLAALALAGTVIPTTLAAHRFWEMDDPAERESNRTHFVKNLSLLGGLLITAVDTGGKPSLGWRTKRAARKASRKVHDVAHTTSDRAQSASESVRDALPV